jgi:hypothetical protein
MSEPETQAVASYVTKVVGASREIVAAIDFHAYGELILRPYGCVTLSICPSVRRSPSISRPLPLHLHLHLSICSVCLCISLSVCLSLSLSHTLTRFISPPPSLSLSLSLYMRVWAVRAQT